MKIISINSIIALLISTILTSVNAQERVLTLEDAIRIAQENSLDYKIAANRLQTSEWNYKNFEAYFLPSIFLEGTVPNYSHNITKITLPSGEDRFVNQNQAFSSLDFGVRQNINFTGGVLSVNSSLNRIDIFGKNRSVNYSTVPVSISYSQQVIGYNRFKWLKKTEPVRHEISLQQYIANMEQIGLQSVIHYFEAFTAQIRKELSQKNLSDAERLYSISQERFKLGAVNRSEILQLRLAVLNAKKSLTQDSVELVLSRQHLSRYLLLPDNFTLHISMQDSLPFFDVGHKKALDQAYENSEAVLRYRLDRIEAEQEVERVKAESNLKFNLQANFGLSNRADAFSNLFFPLESQKNIVISFSLPILDWGFSKTQRMRSKANLAMVQSQIEADEMRLEQEIAQFTSRWNLHQQQLAIAKETKLISEENYNSEVERYLRGTISINDLNQAQQHKDSSISAYFESIRTYWELYYSIRKLTLYDFIHNKKLSYFIKNGEITPN